MKWAITSLFFFLVGLGFELRPIIFCMNVILNRLKINELIHGKAL
jgi:hypothetical protein